ALTLNRGAFTPPAGAPVFGSIGDSAPDTWGRRLMLRAERRRAQRERRQPRTLMEADYLLGVSDVSRSGALRFRLSGEQQFQSPATSGVPGLVELGRLLQITERILRDEETEEDLQLIFAPGSSLGGARPKASVIDRHGRLAIAKFPKQDDDHRIELWEAVALQLAESAGIATPKNELLSVAGKPVLLSHRFDRADGNRVPFLSAMAMTGARDGEHGSYPELVDALVQNGSQAGRDVRELYRRMAFNVLISNVDDHLRNHGFLWTGMQGWSLSPVYDLNPTPVDIRQRILTTRISLDDGTCDIDRVLAVAGFFSLTAAEAKAIVKEAGTATAKWRQVAMTLGARKAEIQRMESAFEHADLRKSLAL
ncbi:MAG TPA: HipA domain-containing protein, partial [Bradyrhizobium sp.]|nr:HipA domain-containing protein [Bradyrhizobium sp.]